jgi:hypothetical protein
MFLSRAAVAVAALLIFDAAVPAGVVTYTLNNRRFFPAADGTVSDATSGGLTSATFDVKTTAYTDPLTGNQFNAVSSVSGSPFQLHDVNSVTLSQPATSSVPNIFTLVSSSISETNVLITGGSGTAYLLPTFHIYGSMDDNNASLQLGIAVCAGNATCVLSGAGSTTTPGFHPVDTLFTPGITSSTAFTFGVPFNIFFFLEPSLQYLGPQANPGATSTVDVRMDLVGMRIADADGNTIGGNIDSTVLDLAAPEPASALLCGLAFLAAGFRLRRKR